jgi:uncharacterized membrane protein required for colicin V production
MHFFGSMGTLSFVFGLVVAIGLILDKAYAIRKHIPYRNATDHPFFYFGLIAIVVGVQLFLAGFLAELITTVNNKRSDDYLITEKVGL